MMGEARRCAGTRSALIEWMRILVDSMPDESQNAWPGLVTFSDIHEYESVHFW